MVREHIRDADIAGRYGGEEFAVLLPDTDKQGGAMFAERLRAAVEALDVMQEGEAIHCTISLGVADMTSPMDDYKMLIERASAASVRDAQELATVVSGWFLDEHQRLETGERARKVVLENRGALQRVMQRAAQLLPV